jgi:hypothetical protein
MKYPVAGLCPRVGPRRHAQPRGEARGKVEATKEHDLGGRGTMGKRAGVGRAGIISCLQSITSRVTSSTQQLIQIRNRAQEIVKIRRRELSDARIVMRWIFVIPKYQALFLVSRNFLHP